MDEQQIFVGRKAELDQSKQVLENPRGQTMVGQGSEHRASRARWPHTRRRVRWCPAGTHVPYPAGHTRFFGCQAEFPKSHSRTKERRTLAELK